LPVANTFSLPLQIQAAIPAGRFPFRSARIRTDVSPASTFPTVHSICLPMRPAGFRGAPRHLPRHFPDAFECRNALARDRVELRAQLGRVVGYQLGTPAGAA